MNTSPPGNGDMPAPKWLVPMVALLTMVGPFSINTYLPSFPEIAADFGVGLGAMAQTMSVYLIAFAMTTLMWGPLADSFGRRRMILGASWLYTVASLGCAFADSFSHLLALRLLQGVAASGGIVIARSVIRDVYDGPHARRAMAQVLMMFALAPAIAPIIGGWLHEWAGWRAVFHFLALYGLVTAILVIRALPETHPLHLRQSFDANTLGRNYVKALRHGRFLALALSFCFTFGGLFVYISGSPAIIFDHLDLGPSSFYVLYVPMFFGVISGSWVAGQLSTRAAPERTVNASILLAAVAVLLNLVQAAWLEPRPWAVVAPVMVYAFAVSLMMPNLTIMALDCFPHNRGMASSVQSFLQMTITALIAALAVPIVAPSLSAYALVQGAFLLCALFFWRRS